MTEPASGNPNAATAARRSRWQMPILIAVIVLVLASGAVLLLRWQAEKAFASALTEHDTARVCTLVKRYPRLVLSSARRNDALRLLTGSDPESFQTLVEHGASLETRGSNGATLLHLASAQGNVKVARYLFSHHFSANVLDDNGETPLHALARAAGALPKGVRDNMLRLLLSEKGDLDLANNAGHTPVEVCEHAGMIGTMLASGASADRIIRKARVTDALPVAANHNDLDLVKLYLAFGANVNTADSSTMKSTALHYAVRNDNLVMAGYLLAHRANPNVTDWHGKTPLFYALKDARARAIADLLRKHGGKA